VRVYRLNNNADRLIRIYPSRNARDAATQTKVKSSVPAEPNDKRRKLNIVLPSQQVHALDYFHATTGEKTVGDLELTTLGRQEFDLQRFLMFNDNY
jgi:hypothetical protein